MVAVGLGTTPHSRSLRVDLFPSFKPSHEAARPLSLDLDDYHPHLLQYMTSDWRSRQLFGGTGEVSGWDHPHPFPHLRRRLLGAASKEVRLLRALHPSTPLAAATGLS